MRRQFVARQVGRMKMVGCDNPHLVTWYFNAFVGSPRHYLADGSLCILGGNSNYY